MGVLYFLLGWNLFASHGSGVFTAKRWVMISMAVALFCLWSQGSARAEDSSIQWALHGDAYYAHNFNRPTPLSSLSANSVSGGASAGSNLVVKNGDGSPLVLLLFMVCESH